MPRSVHDPAPLQEGGSQQGKTPGIKSERSWTQRTRRPRLPPGFLVGGESRDNKSKSVEDRKPKWEKRVGEPNLEPNLVRAGAEGLVKPAPQQELSSSPAEEKPKWEKRELRWKQRSPYNGCDSCCAAVRCPPARANLPQRVQSSGADEAGLGRE